MKKYVIFIFLLTLIFLVGCTKLGNPNDKTKDPNTTDGCKYIDDDRALVGLSDYENIKRAPFCEVYIDILRDMSVQNDYKGNTIIYHDETELIFMNGNGIFYRYKDKNLEEHDVFYLKINTRVATPSILGYNPTTSTLIAAQKSSDVSGISDISVITGYNMNTQSNYQLASSLGTKAKFLYAGPNGYVIEASDKLTVLDWNFQMVKEYSEALYLGSSLYQNDKENVAILIGESIDNKCLVTVYNGTSSTQSTLYDSCDTVQRLNVQSEYVYFVINHKLYKYDASTDSFTLVPLTTANETVNWVATDSVYKANQIFALVLSKSFITVFNNNMDISQSSSANEVYQVGETLYLAKKPNSNDIYIYDFDRTELLKIEEEFAYTSMKYNHLIINKRRCEILYCQDIYKDGTELILSDVLLFKSINKENAIYVDNISDTSYDIMHINFTTKITKKILSLNYSNDPYINFNPVFIAYNNLFTIKDDETGDYHIYDEHGVLIETTTFISRYKTSAGSSKYYLQRDNGEIILFNLYG